MVIKRGYKIVKTGAGNFIRAGKDFISCYVGQEDEYAVMEYSEDFWTHRKKGYGVLAVFDDLFHAKNFMPSSFMGWILKPCLYELNDNCTLYSLALPNGVLCVPRGTIGAEKVILLAGEVEI